MKKAFVLVALLTITGCSLFRSVNFDPSAPGVLAVLSKMAPPSMNKDILNRHDDEIIAWLKSVDNWMFAVIGAPPSGEMDESTKMAVQTHLEKVFAPELAEKLIGYFYHYNPDTKVYQSINTDIMMGLKTDWQHYELKQEEASSDLVTLTLRGTSMASDNWVISMTHRSAYKVAGDQLIAVDYVTGLD